MKHVKHGLKSMNRNNLYYAVVDVEAIVLPKNINLVEQAAIVIVDMWGYEVLAEKFMVYQPLSCTQIVERYKLPLHAVMKSISGYRKVTGDDPIHADESAYHQWNFVRNRILGLCREYASSIYAKGITLENKVFYGELPLKDLNWWGTPKFPWPLHDPLAECRFFAHFIPEIIHTKYYICR